MALFTSYAQPGVYTDVVIGQVGQPLFGATRIPVLIGEGVENQSYPNVELHRGSSAVADDLVVNENISDQVTGTTNDFNLTYFPIVNGDGSGTLTNDPTKIQVTAAGVPVTVIELDGTLGTFKTQIIPTAGTDLEVTYFFKKTDTHIENEDLTYQVPAFATLVIEGSNVSAGDTFEITLTLPGALGNNVTLALTDAGTGNGVADAQAVSGAGTDAISIELRNSADDTIRTLTQVKALVDAGIPTLSSGYMVSGAITGSGSDPADTQDAADGAFSGGAGPSSNTVFKVEHTPVVDGSNGGVVTDNVANIQVTVDSVAATVVALDGAHGLFTLATPVLFGQQLAATYYTNTYANTADLLPAANVADVQLVGLGPNRSDYIQDVDYVLDTDPNTGASTINWGDSAITALGTETAGFTPFGPVQITTTLVNQKVWLRPAGTGDGTKTTFTLEDSPVDGAGRVTDDPALVQVFVGATAFEAFVAGAVSVLRVTGASAQATLYNPPAAGQKVYASYNRSIINDHTFTLKVVNPNIPGQGTYNITDELDRKMPVPSDGTDTVADSGFATTGIVYPFAFSDVYDNPGAIDETVTLTFNSDGVEITSPAVASSRTLQTIVFQASTPGVAGDGVQVAFTSVGASDTNAISTTGDVVTIDIQKLDTSVRTISEVVDLFAHHGAVKAVTTSGGRILATGSGNTQVTTAAGTNLQGGADAVTAPFTMSYTVTSNQALGSAGTGYLGQTYIDARTGATWTIVNPADALSYGYTVLPSPQYSYSPGDTLQFVFSKTGTFVAGDTIIAIAGLQTKVATTLGMNAGDTATITTYNKSGNEPNVGEFYFVTFDVAKSDADMALKTWTNSADAYKVYGQPSVANRLSLAIQLLTANGAQAFGAIQVRKQTGLGVASDSDYFAAIDQLNVPLPGGDHKADVIVPLSTSGAVQAYLSRHLTIQSGIRQKGEGIGFIGYDQFQNPQSMRASARAIKNARVIAVGNPVAAISLTDPTTGVSQEYAVSGEFMAAAMAGMNTNPSNDVATTLTKQTMAGFSRLLIRYDDPTMDQMAADGLTLLVEKNGAFQVRHYKSTDPSNPITSEPTSTTAVDFTRQSFRADLDQFIGRKFTDSLLSDIKVVCNARLRSEVDNQILTGFKNLQVVPDASDPTVVQVSVDVKPIFSLLYINVTFTVTTNL